MYNRYFGFREDPFSIAPDPRFLFMSEMHQEALAHLNYGVSSNGCIVLLTGEIGTGKTTICRHFLEQLDEQTDVAIILNPKLHALELLETICDEFRIPPERGSHTIKHHIDRLNRYLLQTHAVNRRSILVIDEAQNLEKEVLEMVRLLTNLETNETKLLKIFLLGQSELSALLTHPGMTQINQRVTCRYHLNGLQHRDIEDYIKHRIAIAGGGRVRDLFNKQAIKNIHRLSKGIPRLINTLCDRALLGAYAQSRPAVNKVIIKKAAGEVFGAPLPSEARRSLGRVFFSTLLACFLIVIVWFGTIGNSSRQEMDPWLSPVEKNSGKTIPVELKRKNASSLPENDQNSAAPLSLQASAPQRTPAEATSRDSEDKSAPPASPDIKDEEQMETRIIIKTMEVNR